jgi:hypothetical protein
VTTTQATLPKGEPAPRSRVAVCRSTAARDRLYAAYSDRIEVNPDLDRSLVSFQANKAEAFYGWFKYKEGFSSRLVHYLVDRLAPQAGVLLDPFAGAGAALFAARDREWNVIGIELLPVGFYSMVARQAAERVNHTIFAQEAAKAASVNFAEFHRPECAFQHIAITAGAFPPATEKQLAGYRAYCAAEVLDQHARDLMEFSCFCVLEEVSYTRKDGQYLRWDHRSPRSQVAGYFDKGKIAGFRQAIQRKLRTMVRDLAGQRALFTKPPGAKGDMDIRRGSCLEILPEMPANSVNLVLTSPPYCNRYDYTRTYALELAFLGMGEENVKALRQKMLSCTVENKEKVEQLRQQYRRWPKRFDAVQAAWDEQDAVREVLGALEAHRTAGALNNPNVPRMVRNYFYEMAFVVMELARILRPGGRVVMVNDNVRYAGEEVPVDLILSDFAGRFGLSVRHIWTLPRGKGNSSQQMGAHGRRELRKCVYVWQKPNGLAEGHHADPLFNSPLRSQTRQEHDAFRGRENLPHDQPDHIRGD